MAILYVDLVNGNDANNGTTFALRKKTITSAATAMTNGDTVRVMQSPSPTLVGNATWTKDSKVVTLASAVTANVDMCESGWVASSNVAVTYINPGKEGTNCAQFAIAAGFTTGKVAYKALSGNDDYQTFQALSLWLKQTVGTLAVTGDFSIKICSDGTGAAPLVNGTFDFPHTTIGSLNQWMAMTKEGTGNIGAGIQSVALYRNANRGAQTIQLDDIIVCKTASAATSLSLTSFISKNNGEAWAPIRSINGTTIILDQGVNVTAADNTCAYAGVTETVPLYKREGIRFAQMNATTTDTITGMTWATAGTTALRRTLSGGWSTTDMSTKTGDTMLDFVNGMGWGMSISGGNSIVEDISIARAGTAIFTLASNLELTSHSMVGNSTGAILVSTAVGSTYNVANICYNGATAAASGFTYTGGNAANNTLNVTNMCSNYGIGLATIAVNVSSGSNGAQYRETYNIGTLGNNGAVGANIASIIDSKLNFGKAFGPSYPIVFGSVGGATYGMSGQSPYNVTLNITDSVSSTVGDAIRVFSVSDCVLDLRGAAVSSPVAVNALLLSHNADVKVLGGNITQGKITYDIVDSLFIGTTLNSTPKPNDNNAYTSKVTMQNYGGSATDHRIYSPIGTIATSTAQRHTPTGVSWQLNNTNTNTGPGITPAGYNVELKLADVAVSAGTLVTASVWVRQDVANMGARLVMRGVDSDVVVSTTSAAINNWEQITLTFTPSVSAVVSFFGQMNSPLSSGANAWFDDFDVSQA